MTICEPNSKMRIANKIANRFGFQMQGWRPPTQEQRSRQMQSLAMVQLLNEGRLTQCTELSNSFESMVLSGFLGEEGVIIKIFSDRRDFWLELIGTKLLVGPGIAPVLLVDEDSRVIVFKRISLRQTGTRSLRLASLVRLLGVLHGRALKRLPDIVPVETAWKQCQSAFPQTSKKLDRLADTAVLRTPFFCIFDHNAFNYGISSCNELYRFDLQSICFTVPFFFDLLILVEQLCGDAREPLDSLVREYHIGVKTEMDAWPFSVADVKVLLQSVAEELDSTNLLFRFVG